MTDTATLSTKLTGRDGKQRIGATPKPNTQPKFTPDDIGSLYAPFPLEAHSIREGFKGKSRIRWFIYLDRIAIQRRLDELFPGEWEFFVDEIQRNKDCVNITATLTIRGVSRSFNGGHSGGQKNAPENLEKGAMTDTFRRCASLWGLGAYINDGVDIYTSLYEDNNWNEKTERENEGKRKFAAWYSSEFATGNTKPVEPTPPPSTAPETPEAKSEPLPRARKLETKPDEPATQLNTDGLKDAIEFMYPDDPEGFHRRGTIKSMMEDETLSSVTPGYMAIELIMLRRAFKDFLLDEPTVYKALSISVNNDPVIDSFASWYKVGRSAAQAWEAITDYHENVNTLPAEPKSKPGDAPF